MNRYLRFCIVVGLILAFVGSTLAADDLHSRKKLRVGVLVSLTGLWSTLGWNSEVALEIAAGQINDQSDAAHAGYRIELLVRDTQLDPERALQALKELHQHGVHVVIGPQSSAEVEALKPYADANDILLISQSSTASSLAIAGDNIFRFCPDDKHEAEALVALMWHDGIRTIVPLWRNDTGNQGLHDSVRTAFLARGGTVMDGYRYGPDTTDFAPVVSAVRAQVAQAQAEGADPSTVAVYMAAFDKAADIFKSASSDPFWQTTMWYGSDGAANSAALLSDPVVAEFAATHNYPNPLYGLNPSDETVWGPIADAVKSRTGTPADAFALSAYDALFVAYQALQLSEGGKDFARLKDKFVATSNSYTGVTGPTTLNAAGDRMISNFDFWAIREVNGPRSWVVVTRYLNGVLIWGVGVTF